MDAYQPLGTVIVSGLIAGTLLSLLVIPVMHAISDDLQHLLARRARLGAVSDGPRTHAHSLMSASEAASADGETP